MKKRNLLTGIVLLILFAIILIFLKINKSHGNVASEKTDIHISAEKLYSDFKNDENKANEMYLDKVIEVSGKIATVSKQSSQYIILLDATSTGGINCLMLDDSSAIAQLKPAGDITIKGKCTGFLIDVNLNDCVLIK
ncbi:MAG: hypothetical protein ABI653_03560 [Bacteroidota bacterium]